MTVSVAAFQSRPVRLLSLLVLAVGVLLPASTVRAQLGSVSQAMQPDFFTRDLLIFIEGLDLDETQSVIAEAIFDDYQQQFIDGKEAMELEIESLTGQLKEMRGNVDNDQLLEMVVQPIQDWMVRREELNQQLVENVRVILLPDQQERWTAFDRQLFREKKLDDGRLSGERIDLFVVARDLNLSPSDEPLKSLLREYAIQLDRELRGRTLVIEGSSRNLLNTLRSRQDDPEVDLDVRRKINDYRVKVRNVNDRFREEIAIAMPPPTGREFRDEVLRRAYPKVYRLTNGERVFTDALETYGQDGDKNDPEIYAAMNALFDEFLAKLDRLNEDMYLVTRESESELELARIENSVRRARGQELIQPEDPVRELQKKKRELERTYIEKLKDLLGDEAFGQLNGARRYVSTPSPRTLPSTKPTPRDPKGLQLNPNSTKSKKGQTGAIDQIGNQGTDGVGQSPQSF